MNEVKVSGKVLNSYIHDTTGALVVKLAVRHEHFVGRQSVSCESVFNVIMLDEDKIRKADFKVGDLVNITGYLKVDFKTSEKGNEHRKLMVYATNIEVAKSRPE